MGVGVGKHRPALTMTSQYIVMRWTEINGMCVRTWCHLTPVQRVYFSCHAPVAGRASPNKVLAQCIAKSEMQARTRPASQSMTGTPADTL